MNIVLLGNREIASNLGLSLLVAGLAGHRLRIVLSAAGESPAPGLHPALARLIRHEQAMCDALEQDSALSVRAARVGLQGFAALAERTGRPIEVIAMPNSEDGLERLRAGDPDLFISLRYRKILREQAIALAPRGVLNLHSGLLPDYRGVMATFHAMADAAPRIGTTLHLITDAGIDTGPLLQCNALQADYGATYLDNVLALYRAGCAAVLEAVGQLEQGRLLEPVSQPGGGDYYSAPDSRKIQQFLDRGMALSDGGELQRYLEPPPPA